MAANNGNYEELNEEEEVAVRFEPFKCLLSDLISQNKQLRKDIIQLKEHREVHSKKEEKLQDEINQIKKQSQLQYQGPTEQLKDVIDLCRYPFFLLAVTLCIVILGSTYLADPYELCNNRLNEQLNNQVMQNESFQHTIDRLEGQVNSQAMLDEGFQKAIDRLNGQVNNQVMQNESFQHTIDRLEGQVNSQAMSDEGFQHAIDRLNEQVNSQVIQDERFQKAIDRLHEQNQEQVKKIEMNITRLNEKHDKYGSDMNKFLADDQSRSADILEINHHYMLLERNVQAIENYMRRHLPGLTWKQNGITIAGGNGRGNQLNQLSGPFGISIDDDQTIYVADYDNHRIFEWQRDATEGRITAGGNGRGDRINQLNGPTDVIIDQGTKSLIIADLGNRRVMRWSRQNNGNGEVIITDIDCSQLTMDKKRSLYVSDLKNDEVRRWRKGEKGKGTIVAGGNGRGDQLNQLNNPAFIFVDDNESVYVSDTGNHRVVKWVRDREKGIVVGGNGRGQQPNQLDGPTDLSLGRDGNLYVADWGNGRIQKFEIK